MPGKKLLVVEDDEDFRSVITNVLSSAGYAVVAAPNGEEGLAAYAREAPDLVVLDVHLPDMTGIEICSRIRKEGPRPKTPIVLCTVRSEFGPVAEGLAAGATDYVVKPFEIQDLLARVEHALKGAGNA
ncbi:MAG: response regulator transcription factor [Elusimicrobiota bacterium]|jgi:DNA-binding response OmpR family regulator